MGDRSTPRTCEICTATYLPTYGAQRTCGRRCGKVLRFGHGPWRTTSRVWIRTCIECSTRFVTRTHSNTTCGNECRKHRASKRSATSILRRYHSDATFRERIITAAHSRRADKLGLGSQRVTISYLGDRDQWRCGICKTKIRKRQQASIDHIVPLSKGGAHSLENTHIAHLRCNLSKNARGEGEQLLLIG